jgi:hypothetical protein
MGRDSTRSIVACSIVAKLAFTPEGAVVSADEPVVGAFPAEV